MGLLRKAAVTADRGETGTAGPAAAPAVKGAGRGSGLLRRSLRALQKAGFPAPAAAPAPAKLIMPAVEPLVSEDSGILPFKTTVTAAAVEAAPAVAATSVAAAAAPAAAAAAPAPARGRRIQDVLEEVLTAIAALRGGVELPSRLFTALATLLGLRKGALLLYDPVRLVYAPWAVLGYDQTTLHRMRIPLGANDAWNALANGGPISLSDAPAVAPFQQYFSAREMAGVGRLILVPFIAEDKLIAVLIITDIDSPLASEAELLGCLARAAEAGAPRVHEARAVRAEAAGATGARLEPLSLKDEPTRFISSLGGSRKTVLLLSLSVEEYARSVLQAHQHLDPFRLHEDLSYFLGSFVSDVGKVLSVKQGRFIFALPEFDSAGVDIFVHQLSRFLHGLFGSNGSEADGVSPRVLRSASWPADGADLESLVGSLSS